MTATHTFQISTKELEEITTEEKVQTVKNKNHLQLKGNYLEPFLKFINIVEGEEYKLQKRNNTFHENNNKMHLRINADCKSCPKKNGVHYVIMIRKKPNFNEKFVNVELQIKNKHNHEDNQKKNKQYRGDERLKVANDIILAGGSNAYVLEKVAEGKSAPTRSTARKIVSSLKNKGFSSDWIHSLHCTADSFEAQTYDKKLTGYIQQLVTHKEFAMYTYCQEQLEVLHTVPQEYRVAFYDATGNLCRIPKVKREYSRMLNHTILLKDSRQIIDNISGKSTKSSVVADMSTTRQDVYRISDFFRCLKTDYENLYSQTLSFRLIVCDYSWASMHSIVEAFNDQKMEDYSKKVWQLSRSEIDAKEQTWFISCTSHTMKRFVKNIATIVDKSMISFCSYLFSLLINCLDLDSISIYFKLICYALLSKRKTDRVTTSLNALQEGINTRPIDKNEIKKMVALHLKEPTIQKAVALNITTKSIIENNIKKKTIANSSPFTQHFKEIELCTLQEINDENETEILNENNEFYCPEYIETLLKRYMPYCFVWSGFVIKNLNNENTRTRFTNGTVENHFYSNKGMGQFFKKLLPAQYANKSYKLNIGKCREFMSQTHECNSKISSDNEHDSVDEEDRLICRERWAKKNILNLRNLNNNYQACANINLNTKLVAKKILMKAKKKQLKSRNRKTAFKNENKVSLENKNDNISIQSVNISYDQTAFSKSEINEFCPNGNSTILPTKTIFTPFQKFSNINLPTVINLNNIRSQKPLIDLTNCRNNQNNNLISVSTLNTDLFTEVKFEDYRITVKNMSDLKNGHWLSDSVRTAK